MKFNLAPDIAPELRVAFGTVEQLSDKDALLLAYAIVGGSVAEMSATVEQIPLLLDGFRHAVAGVAVSYWLGLQEQKAALEAQQTIQKAMQR